tara:strand:- start:176 stop:304 length:129 start_codon:yes stop_codon:yes gene_type:complete
VFFVDLETAVSPFLAYRSKRWDNDLTYNVFDAGTAIESGLNY